MAKLSSINKNEKRKKMVKQHAAKFAKLRAVADDDAALEAVGGLGHHDDVRGLQRVADHAPCQGVVVGDDDAGARRGIREIGQEACLPEVTRGVSAGLVPALGEIPAHTGGTEPPSAPIAGGVMPGPAG